MGLTQYSDNGLFAPRKIAGSIPDDQRGSRPNRGARQGCGTAQGRIRPDKTQRRLREMVEMVNKVEPRFGRR